MNWQRLAQAIIDRRVELGFRTREAFAGETGLSSRLLGDLERAQRDNYDSATISRLEHALQWPSGTARSILAGNHGGESVVLDLSPDGGPLQSRLYRLVIFGHILPPADQARLLASLDMTLEWVQGRLDATMTDEERIAPDFGPDGPQRPSSRRTTSVGPAAETRQSV